MKYNGVILKDILCYLAKLSDDELDEVWRKCVEIVKRDEDFGKTKKPTNNEMVKMITK